MKWSSHTIMRKRNSVVPKKPKKNPPRRRNLYRTRTPFSGHCGHINHLRVNLVVVRWLGWGGVGHVGGSLQARMVKAVLPNQQQNCQNYFAADTRHPPRRRRRHQGTSAEFGDVLCDPTVLRT